MRPLPAATPQSVRRSIACCLIALAAFPAHFGCAKNAEGGSEQRLSFDIPSQPLTSALNAYARTAGVSVLFDSELTAGYRSVPLHGDFIPSEALQRLLTGTPLAVSYASATAFTLVRASRTTTSTDTVEAVVEDEPMDHYARTVQSNLEHALCQSAETRPGPYRAVVQLWLAETGRVERVRLVGSTGLAQRDAALEASLRLLSVEPPPPAFEQPLTILLLPETAQSTRVCASARLSTH